jgi:RNA polymerase sigma-70 factor, ECF subfamily
MDASVPPSDAPPANFERVVLAHRDAAYNLARWLMREDHDAEDCVQEACLRAYHAFGRFDHGDGRTWLLAIVRNVCYSHLRQSRREQFSSFNEIEHSQAADPPVREVPWEQTAARELLPQALDQLPVEAREILVLHAVEGLAYREIADVLAVPIGTVMSRLARARLKLQSELHQLLQKDLSRGL